ESRAAKTVQVNQLGVLAWTRAAWRSAMAEHGGVVLNLSSVGGMQAEGGIGWYNVTKAAVIHLTTQLAGELGPGVRVNALAPGLVKTDFAKAALFLCSDAASWITGDTVVVDGGALSMPSGGVG
ncbi:MAG TPA: SDR family oxidoreductase, partial [Acidimicrobiales bacterium]|nr:SDR family oxidoreductase [Acidimicrobiales bacterium]